MKCVSSGLHFICIENAHMKQNPVTAADQIVNILLHWVHIFVNLILTSHEPHRTSTLYTASNRWVHYALCWWASGRAHLKVWLFYKQQVKMECHWFSLESCMTLCFGTRAYGGAVTRSFSLKLEIDEKKRNHSAHWCCLYGEHPFTLQRITRSDKRQLSLSLSLVLSLTVFEVTLPLCAQISGRMTDDYRAAEHHRWKATLTHECIYSYAALTCVHPQLTSTTCKPILTQPAHTNRTHTRRQSVDLCKF